VPPHTRSAAAQVVGLPHVLGGLCRRSGLCDGPYGVRPEPDRNGGGGGADLLAG